MPAWRVKRQIEFLFDGDSGFHTVEADGQRQFLSVLKNVDGNRAMTVMMIYPWGNWAASSMVKRVWYGFMAF